MSHRWKNSWDTSDEYFSILEPKWPFSHPFNQMMVPGTTYVVSTLLCCKSVTRQYSHCKMRFQLVVPDTKLPRRRLHDVLIVIQKRNRRVAFPFHGFVTPHVLCSFKMHKYMWNVDALERCEWDDPEERVANLMLHCCNPIIKCWFYVRQYLLFIISMLWRPSDVRHHVTKNCVRQDQCSRRSWIKTG